MTSDQALTAFAAHFSRARDFLGEIIEECARYGLEVKPSLELRQGEGLFCYYDLSDGHIYLSLPRPGDPLAALKVLFFRSLLGNLDNREVVELIGRLLPFILAHELGHCLRHRLGLFGTDLWHEEQIANQFAVAITKRRLAPADIAATTGTLQHALDGLEQHMKSRLLAVDTFHSPLHALNVTGEIEDHTIEQMQLMNRLFAMNPMEILRDGGVVDSATIDRLARREDVINAFNEEYTSNAISYLFHQLGWLRIELESRNHRYLEEVARRFFGRTREFLPPVGSLGNPDDSEILACCRAARDLKPVNQVASRYFYKRYRTLLFRKLQTYLRQSSQIPDIRESGRMLLENWTDEEAVDALDLAMLLAPPGIQRLFPGRVGPLVDSLNGISHLLVEEADMRLWSHLAEGKEDHAAAETLRGLTELESNEIFDSLPAEVLLELAEKVTHVILVPGETIIWEASRNDDVFVLLSGLLEAVNTSGVACRRIGLIRPGESFGEMAFFTRDPRTATVRAIESSVCLVLESIDLRVFSARQPGVLMQMGRVLSRRLAKISDR